MSQANASELGNAGTAPGFKLWRLFKRGASVSGQGGRQTVDLSERIDQLLGLRLREFTMPADLLAIYHMQARSGTHRMMIAWCIAVGLLNMPCALFDVFLIAPQHRLCVLTFRLLITTLFMGSAILIQKRAIKGFEDFAILVACLSTVTCAGFAGLYNPGQGLLEHYLVNAIVIVFTCLMFIQMDQRTANMLVAGSLTIMFAFLVASGWHHVAEKLQTGMFYFFVMMALARARQVNDIYRHRMFLMNTREELRGLAAVERNQQLSSIAYLDPLTGVPNRRYFEEQCESVAATIADQLPVSLCMFDLDSFKSLNDQLGHLQGDACLRVVARAIYNSRRSAGDILARYGGEEFILLLPNTDTTTAVSIADRIREAILDLKQPNPGTATGFVTVSVGVSTVTSGPLDIQAMVKTSDVALYRAKASGRNQVCI
jgi:diguanylate cyclase (GGDEF)-like protein